MRFSFLQYKLTRDIAWTMSSLVVLAVSGIVINLVVATLRDAAALGVFNQAYAVYIVASQIAVFGLHYSVLRHAAYYESDASERGRMLMTAAVSALALGAGAALMLYLTAPLLGSAFDSEPVGRAVRYAAFGLLLFPLNKVLLAYLNGLRLMKAFSVLQAGRYIIVMCWVGWVAARSDQPFEQVTLAFLVAEVLTSCAALAYLWRRRLLQQLRFERSWIGRHFIFGSKSLLAGMFVEMNSRVDVLMIGLFLSDREAGIYSFAVMLVDGLYHVLAMVKINFNPILVAATRDDDLQSAQRLLTITKRYGYVGTIALAIIAFGAFLFLAHVVVPSKGLSEGTVSLAILLSGLTLICAFIPFDNLMLSSGHPGLQTIQHLAAVAANIALNALLIPHFGIEGAACATATSYLLGAGVMMLFARRILGWDLLNNRVTS